MKVNLTLNIEKVESLKAHLGEDRVTTIGKIDNEGYIQVIFDINNSMDVLHVMHAGQDFGLLIGLGKYVPGKKYPATVA